MLVHSIVQPAFPNSPFLLFWFTTALLSLSARCCHILGLTRIFNQFYFLQLLASHSCYLISFPPFFPSSSFQFWSSYRVSLSNWFVLVDFWFLHLLIGLMRIVFSLFSLVMAAFPIYYVQTAKHFYQVSSLSPLVAIQFMAVIWPFPVVVWLRTKNARIHKCPCDGMPLTL